MNIIECNEDQLDEFYDKWALTFEGTTVDNDNLEWLKNWFNSYGCTMLKEDFYVIKGKMMNHKYHLTGNNAYPDNINILVIKLEDLSNVEAIAVPRFEISGRWFTDIVEGNKSYE